MAFVSKNRNVFASVILLLAILFVVQLAFAEDDISIKVIPIDDSISAYEEATFNVTIANLKNVSDTISIYSPNVDLWSVKINPDLLYLADYDSDTLQVRVMPKSDVQPGKEYGIQLNIRSDETSKLYKVYAFVNLMSQDQINREYIAIISVNASDLSAIDPTESKVFTLDIENKNVRNLKDLRILLQSKIFNQDAVTDLGPLERKSIQFTIQPDSSIPPGEDNIIVTFRDASSTILSKAIPYEILGVEKQDYDAVLSSSFMLVNHDVIIVNKGNVEIEGTYKIKTNLLNYFFIHGDADSRLKAADWKLYKEYYVTLAPGESKKIVLYVSYRPVLYLILLAIIITSLYYLLRSPLVVRKAVASIRTKEDSLTDMKILLHIKNRSKKTFEDLIVLDCVPKITEVARQFDIGTIKPSKVMQHEKKGTIVRWDIPYIDSYEERVVSYSLSSNLNILGGLTLPVALLKFRNKKGIEKMVSSNRIKLVIQKFIGQNK